MNPIIRTISERIRDHLTKQNAQALENGPLGGCRYRGHSGKMCAVGCLIDAKHYSGAFEGSTVAEDDVFEAVLSSLEASGIHARSLSLEDRATLRDVLDDWQVYHDGARFDGLHYVKWLTLDDPDASPAAAHERIMNRQPPANEG